MGCNHRPLFTSDGELGPSVGDVVFHSFDSLLTGHWYLKG